MTTYYTMTDVSTGDPIKAGTDSEQKGINILINNLYYEQERRGKTATTSSPAKVGSTGVIYASTFQELYDAITNLKTISGMTYVSKGDIISYTHYNGFREAIDALHNSCACQCNYCTCQCNYCTCQCNYCTCKCNYCTCNCNYCTCACNYACTCNCAYSKCSCNCNYCTCNCNYACTCNCNYCTCNCNYCTCNCNYCTCDCNYCTCNTN